MLVVITTPLPGRRNGSFKKSSDLQVTAQEGPGGSPTQVFLASTLKTLPGPTEQLTGLDSRIHPHIH